MKSPIFLYGLLEINTVKSQLPDSPRGKGSNIYEVSKIIEWLKFLFYTDEVLVCFRISIFAKFPLLDPQTFD